ncbi:hypothetical protein Pfo_003496 [Paulownia fortunei]|nr:hypothetical protein Pfo_003496 [Paulownia fortunei]
MEGLHYIDVFSHGRANNMHHTGVKERQNWLWHNRLRHPSFLYLKCLFLDLFSKLNESDFRCEVCIQAKNYRVPYPIRLNKCKIHFSIVLSDVWGLASISISLGVRWLVTFVDDCT